MIHGGLLVRRVACITLLLALFALAAPAVRDGDGAARVLAQEKKLTIAF
jgi:hypothetical protein